MGWWVVATLTLNCQKLQNKGGWDQSWRLWSQTILSTNTVRCNASPLIKNLKSIPTWKTGDEDDEEAEYHDTSRAPTPTDPFLLVSVELVETWPPADFLPLGWASFPLSRWGLLAKDGPLDPGTGRFSTVKWNPVCGLVLPPLLEGKDWDKLIEDCCWACARDQLIWPYRQASLGGISSLRLWRKENYEAHTSWHCLETKLHTCAKIQVELPTHLETALSEMSWSLRSNSCTSDTGIMPPSELGREDRVSRRATLRWEMSCSVLWVTWAATLTPICKSDRDWSAFLLAEVKVMLSGGVDDWNPKAAGWLEK